MSGRPLILDLVEDKVARIEQDARTNRSIYGWNKPYSQDRHARSGEKVIKPGDPTDKRPTSEDGKPRLKFKDMD